MRTQYSYLTIMVVAILGMAGCAPSGSSVPADSSGNFITGDGLMNPTHPSSRTGVICQKGGSGEPQLGSTLIRMTGTYGLTNAVERVASVMENR